MKYGTLATSLSFIVPLLHGAHASEINMNPGLWHWTAVLENPGIPMPLPPTTYTTCITKANFVPKESQLGQACETIDLKTQGDKVSWNISCTRSVGVTKSHGSITYHGDTAEGIINVDLGGVVMSSKATGKRLGPCKQ
ncbi:MAG: DUF3617 family protein [Candidatus Thiodiazotropha sp.]